MLSKSNGKRLSPWRKANDEDFTVSPFALPTRAMDLPFRPEEAKGLVSLGQVIQRLRKERGISQEALARKAGVGRSMTTRVENGKICELSLGNLEKIAKALGTDLKRLLIQTESLLETFDFQEEGKRTEFSLDFLSDGFRIISQLPLRREIFSGKINIKPSKTIPSHCLPHPELVFLYPLVGKIMILVKGKESFIGNSHSFTFCGLSEYELYNTDPIKESSTLLITYPSFLPQSP